MGDWELLALKARAGGMALPPGGFDGPIPGVDGSSQPGVPPVGQACLNPRQARWSLLFNRFDFSLSYCPGSRNGKPDALSRLHASPPETQTPETIVPSRTLVAATRLEIEDRVERSLGGEAMPVDTPANRMYMPEGLAQRSCSGLTRPPWPVTRESAALCPYSAIASAGLVSSGLGGVRGLSWFAPGPRGTPRLQESAAPLALLSHRFSKSAHFVPLPKLPSAKETAQILVQHVFRLHGLPLEVTLGRGPQFTSAFWKAFCALVGVKPQLSSGFHPQTNGQTERLNQELEKSLHCLVEGSPSSWAASLLWVEYAHNSLLVSSTDISPFACCLGYQPPISPEEEKEVGVPAARVLVQRMCKTWEKARRVLL